MNSIISIMNLPVAFIMHRIHTDFHQTKVSNTCRYKNQSCLNVAKSFYGVPKIQVTLVYQYTCTETVYMFAVVNGLLNTAHYDL